MIAFSCAIHGIPNRSTVCLVGEDATLTVVVSCGWCRDIGDNSISGPIPGSIVSLSVLQELYVLPHSNLHL